MDQYNEHRYSAKNLTILGVETVFWGFIYQRLVLNSLVPSIRTRLSKQAFWPRLESKQGQFMKTLEEECVISLALAVHHLISGGLMLLGYLKGDPELWVRGVTIELGYEIVDTYALIASGYPYSHMSSRRLKVATLMHHLPTLFLVPFMLGFGYHANPSFQRVGWSLIGAGGVSFLCESVKKTRNLKTEIGSWIVIHMSSLIVMVLVRFVVFFRSSSETIEMIQSRHGSGLLVYVLTTGALMMLLFNLFLLATYLQKLQRHTRRLWNPSKSECMVDNVSAAKRP